MGQRRLAGSRRVAAADQAGRADRVMRGAERPAADGPCRRAARRRWRSAPPRAPPRARAAAGSKAAGWPPATSRPRAARSSAGCARPAAATSSAWRRWRWPRRSARSGAPAGAAAASGIGSGGCGAQLAVGQLRKLIEPLERDDLDAADERRLGAILGRHDDRLRPALAAASVIARTPGTRAHRAVQRQLPDHRRWRSPPTAAGPDASSSAAAMARSRPGPALRRLAGARLATMRRRGNSKPQLASAARTRSRASRTAASGSPTTEKAGSPRWTSTSTRTGRASMPSSVNVRAVASIGDARPQRARGAPAVNSPSWRRDSDGLRVAARRVGESSLPARHGRDRAVRSLPPMTAPATAARAAAEELRRQRGSPPAAGRSSSAMRAPRYGELDIVALDGANARLRRGQGRTPSTRPSGPSDRSSQSARASSSGSGAWPRAWMAERPRRSRATTEIRFDAVGVSFDRCGGSPTSSTSASAF